MNMNIDNVSGHVINTPQVGGNGVSPDAVGGNISYPLPYPAAHVGAIAIGANVDIEVKAGDFRRRHVMWSPLEPRDEWNQMVQSGLVDLTVSGTANGDQEELFIAQV